MAIMTIVVGDDDDDDGGGDDDGGRGDGDGDGGGGDDDDDDDDDQEQNDYKTFIRTVGNLLLRDSGLNLTEQEKKYRVETFVSDAFFVESELAMVSVRF